MHDHTKTRTRIEIMMSSQTELDFPAKSLPRTHLLKRRAIPQPNRLVISPEAFGEPQNAVSGRGGHHEGILEAVVALLATVAFGLGWAAVELERVEFHGSGYAVSSPAPSTSTATPTARALWNPAAAHPDPGTRARSKGAEISPPAAGRAPLRAQRRNDRWTRIDPTVSKTTRLERKAIENGSSAIGFEPVEWNSNR